MGLLLGACATGGGPITPDPAPRPVRIATGNEGGVYLDYGGGIAEALRRRLPALTPEVLVTGASVENLELLAAGRADVAFTLADAAADAGPGVVALARIYENYLQVVVRADSEVQSLEHLRDRPVSVGAAKSGTAVAARRVLAAAEVTAQEHTMELQASADALADRDIDALFWSGGLPTDAITELGERVPLRLVDLAGIADDLAEGYRDFYTEAVVPASAYGGAAVTTVSVPNYLVVRRDLPDDVAYALTWLLFTERATVEAAHQEARRLDLRAAIATYPLDLHPGAARFYRAAKR